MSVRDTHGQDGVRGGHIGHLCDGPHHLRPPTVEGFDDDGDRAAGDDLVGAEMRHADEATSGRGSMVSDEPLGDDGLTYGSGFRIPRQHCGECGRADGTRQRYSTTRVEPLATTACCGALPCYGYVTSTPWVGHRTWRLMWACCIGEAGRRLGEPVSLVLPSKEGGATWLRG